MAPSNLSLLVSVSPVSLMHLLISATTSLSPSVPCVGWCRYNMVHPRLDVKTMILPGYLWSARQDLQFCSVDFLLDLHLFCVESLTISGIFHYSLCHFDVDFIMKSVKWFPFVFFKKEPQIICSSKAGNSHLEEKQGSSMSGQKQHHSDLPVVSLCDRNEGDMEVDQRNKEARKRKGQ